IKVLLLEWADDRGPEAGQSPRLSVNPLLAGRERDRPPAAHVDVKVQTVLDRLDLRHHLEPDPWPVTVGVDDAVRAETQVGLWNPEVAVVVIPGGEPSRRRIKHVPQRSGPEASKRLRLGTINHQLKPNPHGCPPRAADRT